MEGEIVYSEPRCDMLRNAGYPGVPSAAEVRASIERGDSLWARHLLTVGDKIDTRFHKGASYLAPAAATTVEAVAEHAGSLAATEGGEGTLAAGEDSAAMEHLAVNSANRAANDARWQRAVAEHERQRRLRSWQEQR